MSYLQLDWISFHVYYEHINPVRSKSRHGPNVAVLDPLLDFLFFANCRNWTRTCLCQVIWTDQLLLLLVSLDVLEQNLLDAQGFGRDTATAPVSIYRLVNNSEASCLLLTAFIIARTNLISSRSVSVGKLLFM